MNWLEIVLLVAFCFIALLVFVMALFVTFRLRRKHSEELSRHQQHLDTKHGKKRTTENLPKDSTWTRKIKGGFAAIGLSWAIGILLTIFFFVAFSTNWLDPSHIYEEAMSKVVAVIAIFILCGAAWFGFPKNNKVRFLGMFVGGTLLAAIVIGGLSNHAKNTLPQNTLRVNGHSDSARVPVKVGHGLAWSGNSFSVHCVYRDGRPEVVINDLSRACDTGPLLEEYVHNNSSVEQIYTYEDVR